MKSKDVWVAPVDLDKECLALCVALNKLPGISTTNSCCGHGKSGYWIFFEAEKIENLDPICYFVDSCHVAAFGWKVLARTDCSMKRTSFLLEGPVGDYEGAQKIAEELEEFIIGLEVSV